MSKRESYCSYAIPVWKDMESLCTLTSERHWHDYFSTHLHNIRLNAEIFTLWRIWPGDKRAAKVFTVSPREQEEDCSWKPLLGPSVGNHSSSFPAPCLIHIFVKKLKTSKNCSLWLKEWCQLIIVIYDIGCSCLVLSAHGSIWKSPPEVRSPSADGSKVFTGLRFIAVLIFGK